MDLEEVLEKAQNTPELASNITEWRRLPSRPAQYAEWPESLHPRLVKALQERGIKALYTHQAIAFNALAAGKNLMVVTPTASGKTLCYNLPVLNRLLQDKEARALYLFPTKALSQDQLDELQNLLKALDEEFRVYTFDGDTPVSARKAIRLSGHVVVTNPDMLHQGILPHHTKWLKLFENLRFVVLDELHQYKGVFGSHMANLIRRLKRICRFYGSRPQFICCSATLANPQELAEKVLEEEVFSIEESGAPRGPKHFLFYNPPLIDKALGIRRGLHTEARRLGSFFMIEPLKSILFARSRLSVEVLVTYLQKEAREKKKSPALVRGYRGGYLPMERREIESSLRDGKILVVVSTNALELGIDIGQLDICLMAGYAGTIASTWQQAGRAGRTERPSLAMLIASSSPLDQYIINHPDYFFGLPPEEGVLDPDNLPILLSHIKCAAFELPFEDGETFGLKDISEILTHLQEHGLLRHVGKKWHYMSEVYPAEEVSLRSASPENVVIMDREKNKTIGEVDYPSAPLLVHEGAIYIHQGQQYSIEALDLKDKKAYAKKVEVDYYTDAQSKTEIKVLEVFEQEAQPLGQKAWGEVSLTTLPTMYKKIRFYTHENIGSGRIHLPPQEMHTTAYWWELTLEEAQGLGLEEADLSGGLRALSTLMVNAVPLYIMSEPRDIRAVAMVRAPFSRRPTIYIYDNYTGGVGFSQRLFKLHQKLLIACRELVLQCPCSSGCPSCVGPPLEVGEKGKQSALILIKVGLVG